MQSSAHPGAAAEVDVQRGVPGANCPVPRQSAGRLAAEVQDASLSHAQPRRVAWSLGWLRQIYGHCLSQPDCRNEFGVVWRYRVPEGVRSQKRPGRCLCKQYADREG